MDTARSIRLPDFIAVGPRRTATTWLNGVLRRRVGLPLNVKETHFFSRNYKRGLTWYEGHFRHCADELVVGEICPAYFLKALSRERISMHIPRCRIVITLRDPVERLYSFYKLRRRSGLVEAGFADFSSDTVQVLSFSSYANHVRDWQAKFGGQNVLVVINDDLEKDSKAYLDNITDFIGIGRIDIGAERARDKINTIEVSPRSARLARTGRQLRNWLGSHRMYRTRRWLDKAGVWRFCFEGGPEFSPLDPSVKRRLRDLLRPEIDSLEDLLERDLSRWKNATSQSPELATPEITESQRRIQREK
jgi:hypothetical protein